ncbi:endonuclease/exonuclease/phosphatase family metal-dependent hydrolase [Caldicoprobacter guelmensis]|uniref:endonuclease/exonuclease/phosphatase family protein n=1 Tax=Caldicoprobacter guelmensis TaxID=1170224 RepID=UPI00195CACEE|nr:endonuclease/exonuclease/phosphatase family protein [Caldicoprobacter guelmensis]MBM7581824.1 endonuclease/exonuclease/phosphatase family metal-dependent hydrolase [Caldicoprobacter guelmensis]
MRRKGIHGFMVFLIALFTVCQLVAFLNFRTGYVIRHEDFVEVSIEPPHPADRGDASRGRVDDQLVDGDDMQSQDDKEILLLSFNIRHGVDHKGRESLRSIIEEIKGSKAHIIALQEVDYYMPRSRFKNQAREIASALGFYYVYGETINVLGIKYGNAIISVYPIIEHQNIRLYSSSLEKRAILKAKVSIEGDIYHILNVHLGLKREERQRQIEEINGIVENLKGNVILMGDFNEQAYSLDGQSISDSLVDTAIIKQKEYLNTYAFYSDTPNTRIDRIYVSKDIEVIDHFVVPSKTSDHSMVFALISHKKNKKAGII